MAQTLYDKLWDSHVVHVEDDGTALLYIDRHLVHEVTSAQAYEGLKVAGRKPWRISSIVATADHNTPTTNWASGLDGIRDPISRQQISTLDANIRAVGAAAYFPFLDKRQGIVHVIGPEQGATLPGMTVVCGDSHTSTHGAFGCLAHGIGTSEVEHVLATQCLVTRKMKNMRVSVEGPLGRGVTAKDVVLAIIGRIGTAGGTGSAIEFAGSAIRSLSMEGRMTLCNMSIEAGARAGMVAPDGTTYDYLRGREHAPQGKHWDAALALWQSLPTDAGAKFDREVSLDAAALEPMATWGTAQDEVAPLSGRVPDPKSFADPERRARSEAALAYMDLTPGTRSPLEPVHIEQPGARHSKPAARNTSCRPSASAAFFTPIEPGTTMAGTLALRPLTTSAASRRSSMRALVHEPMNTRSTFTSLSGVPGVRSI